MRTTDTHVYFYTNVFSNWYSTKDIKPQFKDPATGIVWNNTEEAFMYYKARFHGDGQTANRIIDHANNYLHPSGVKDLGRQVKGYNDKFWSCVRLGYMTYVNYLKFSQNPDFKEQLLATGDKTLVEASPVDGVWGVKLAENDDLILDEKNWNGQNLLGKALMEVRKLLRR
jgi:ribA/ribD-fused uncharacterized protein